VITGVPRRYRSSQREARARQTRQRILAAASAVFLQRGYAAATIRAIAAEAGVSVPTVEALFGTKARVLKAAIDVAIAGDDEPVGVLDRQWAATASAVSSAAGFCALVAEVIAAAQARSAGLVIAAFEGSAADPMIAEVADQLVQQRATTATWLVGALARIAPLRAGSSRAEAIDTLWVLMDPVLFDRLIRRRGWTQDHYQRWLAASIGRLLIADAQAEAVTTC
jgi:AcrR family transcriptional regulator